MVTAARLTIILLCFCPLLALPACQMQTRVVSEPWWNQLPADKPAGSNTGSDRQAQGLWTITLERFTGHNRQAHARAFIANLQQQAGLRDLWSEDVAGTVTVYRGRFADPGSEEARRALQRTRRIQLNDERTFADVRLTSLGSAGQPRVTSPHDLRQFPGYYTLQIGYYDDRYDGDFRDAAEQRVRELRKNDYDAYFYHGPHRSLITVGLFTYEEAFVTASDPTAPRAQVDTYAPTIRELQNTFPHNLRNGRRRPDDLDDTAPPDSQGPHHSFVVRVF